MGCNEWRSGTSTSRPFARPSARRGARTALVAVQRGAVVQMAWEASQQLLTGTVREGGGRARGGEIRTVSASFRASPGFPLRFREGYCSCARGTNCVHVAALVLAATDETLLPATTVAGAAARRSALPWEQSLDSLLATPQARAASAAGDGTANAPLAVELSLVRNTTEPFRYPSYSTDNGRHEPPAEDATRKFKLQARLVQPGRLGGWVAGNLSWSRLDYLLLRDEFPPRTSACCTSCYALYRASASAPALRLLLARTPPPATATRSTWTCPPASPASCGPCSSRRTRSACPSSTGASRAPCRRRARRSCAWTSPRKAPRCSSPR